MGFEQPEEFKTQILMCNRLRIVLLCSSCKELMVSLAYNFIIPMRHSVSSSLSPFPQILKEFRVNFSDWEILGDQESTMSRSCCTRSQGPPWERVK
ncbi:hypothetical protein Pan54_28920 [Rubinisphaera italica]|uniref:Uncharacterized protein n=1 Tax=Rubinisphaera italica TaxID=2527969 RepID=A0A5C5XIG9_9PLAN|nr:hypothetical protein Pan54_28920 [Rubinisphaera italica]